MALLSSASLAGSPVIVLEAMVCTAARKESRNFLFRFANGSLTSSFGPIGKDVIFSYILLQK